MLGLWSVFLAVGREDGCKVAEAQDKWELHPSLTSNPDDTEILQDMLEPSTWSCTCMHLAQDLEKLEELLRGAGDTVGQPLPRANQVSQHISNIVHEL